MSAVRPRLRLLCLALHTPIPEDTGDAIRVLGLLRALASTHDVDFVSVRRDSTDDDAVGRLHAIVSGRLTLFLPPVPPSPARAAAAARWMAALAAGEPPWTRAHRHPAMGRYLADLRTPVDAVVFLDNAVTIHWSALRVDAPFIADIHNVAGWSIAQVSGGRRSIQARMRSTLDTRLVRRSERSSIGAMAGVVVTSDEEAVRLSTLYSMAAAAVVPSGIRVPDQPLRAAGVGTVGWLGGHGYRPNREGLVRFVSEAWSALGQAGYRLLVAGGNPPAEVVALARFRGVEILGYVDDLQAFLSRLDVAVVPLWDGAGVKLKTVTFLGAGIPVVSTSVGAEGTGLLDGVHGLIREQPPDLAHGLRSVLTDGKLAAELATNGRSLAIHDLAWPVVGRKFVEAVEGIVSASGEAGSHT